MNSLKSPAETSAVCGLLVAIIPHDWRFAPRISRIDSTRIREATALNDPSFRLFSVFRGLACSCFTTERTEEQVKWEPEARLASRHFLTVDHFPSTEENDYKKSPAQGPGFDEISAADASVFACQSEHLASLLEFACRLRELFVGLGFCRFGFFQL